MSQVDPRLLQLLQDPSKLAALTQLLEEQEEKVPTTFAPFYRNKHGKVTKGHLGIAKMIEGLELTPIFEEEAISLGLMTKAEASKLEADGDMPKDLNNPDATELENLKARAKELGVPNWHTRGAASLRGEIAKAERKLKEAGEDE